MRIICMVAGVLLAVAAITVEWTQRHEGARAATVLVEANEAFLFVQQDITITEGDTVQWTVVGAVPHNVTSADSPASFTGSGTLNAGNTYSLLFNTPGSFTYFCGLHAGPTQYPGGMTGRITVQAAATATATNTVAADTATPTLTSTPTATGTPQATATSTTTPAATVTAPAATATPIAVAPISAAQPAVRAAPSLRVPAAGDGSAVGEGSPHAVSLALAAIGAALIAGAAARRRSP